MAPPNIVLLHSHNTGRHIQPYGYNVPTPRLQQLAEEGVLFRQAYTTSPTCSPSRSCTMTGQYPHTNGMIGLAHRGFRLHDYQRTLIQHFNQAGYHTVLAGLQHLVEKEDLPTLGYKQRLAPASRYGADVAEAAEAFLHDRPVQPFLLDAGTVETHIPFPEPTEEDDPRYLHPPTPLPDAPETRRDMAGLRASARNMDRCYGAILDALDRHGLRDNTLVVCITDHGLQLPRNMCNLTDHGIETFMIMRGPRGFTGGKVCEKLISHIDIFPTLCEAAGISIPDWVQGRSFLPDQEGEIPTIRDRIFAEVNYHAAYEPQRCVRGERWKYIRRYDQRHTLVQPNADMTLSRQYLMERGWADQPRWQEGLFDLVFDPDEQHNLAGEPRMESTLDDMRRELDRWMDQTEDPLRITGRIEAPVGAKVNDVDGVSPKEDPRVIES